MLVCWFCLFLVVCFGRFVGVGVCCWIVLLVVWVLGCWFLVYCVRFVVWWLGLGWNSCGWCVGCLLNMVIDCYWIVLVRSLVWYLVGLVYRCLDWRVFWCSWICSVIGNFVFIFLNRIGWCWVGDSCDWNRNCVVWGWFCCWWKILFGWMMVVMLVLWLVLEWEEFLLLLFFCC